MAARAKKPRNYRANSADFERQDGIEESIDVTACRWYSRKCDARKAGTDRKIHVTTIWSKWFDSARRQLVRRSVLEGCCGPRKEAASAGENLPDLRFQQPLSNRTETQGQGNNRGQRSGYRGIF